VLPRSRITTEDRDRLRLLIQARRSKNEVRDSLWLLDRKLSEALVFQPEHIPGDVITLYSRVCIINKVLREVFTFTLVFPGEASLDEGKLSVLSPIGIALFGAAEGESVVAQTPGGRVGLSIRELVYQPESADRR